MHRQSLNRDWQFLLTDAADGHWPRVDESSWRTVRLPHDWSIELPRDPGSRSGSHGGYFQNGTVANAAEGNTTLTDRENCTKHGRVDVRFANQDWQLQLATYINRGSLVDAEDNLLSVSIGASITGNRALAGRAVDRNGGAATLYDVENISKNPEAHTGGLAPTFTLNRSIEKTADPAGGQSDLNWVTKF